MPPGKMPTRAPSECIECSAKIVPRIQITNKKGRYLGFSQKFEGIWAIFLPFVDNNYQIVIWQLNSTKSDKTLYGYQ